MTERKSWAGVTPDEASARFYQRVLDDLAAMGVPFLVGGAYAFRHYTHIDRCTRDFDVFMKPEDVPGVLERLCAMGYDAGMTFDHWLAKVRSGDDYVDIIFSSGNGVARVDPVWFDRSVEASVLDRPVRLIPVEEMIWSKAFIMERERFDGADIVHLIHAVRGRLDWDHLIERFDRHGRVLLAHLLLFGYVYPSERHLVPLEVLRALFQSTVEAGESRNGAVCRGTLLSRSQYLPDLDRGYRDARLRPLGALSAEEIGVWTEAAETPAPTVTPPAEGEEPAPGA